MSCHGVPVKSGSSAALEITKEFAYRPWHKNATCAWESGRLVLIAENDFDSDGRALMDEFSDAISACIEQDFDGEIKIESVTQF
jgi:hypothetical protein